ncbi:3'(2'),5'-bisphosphate nucleotidase CysQ [Brevundimonas sp. Leaf363]|uniref:3'(2'),5'-bisphosphate nucleotidase CysQ n=1 Tax=Brevundimonas sp. Leaf363 TaxID=1736353 RepID=UPI0006F58103|nr:3'(2'),5'-bisphosphate nucleotidase CysQ [Brevundimonas sp. Leaf363]KQS53744.1 3'(2'),5'-bisphosphate nucleotidase CysQ [Brevundimonas sp. Leaf363]
MSDQLQADLASGALTEALADIAEAAGRVILPYWRAGAQVSRKADASPVTEADQKAEALILTALARRWPGVQAVAEESVAADGAPSRMETRRWLIDPLDGTRGFVEGRESFTVNIALIEGDAPVAGVIHAPATGQTWRTVTPGEGAAKRHAGGDWAPIHVRARPDEPVALVSLSITEDAARALADATGCMRWIAMDSSLKFCLLAEGGADAYARTGPTYEWDTAAGQAVLEAAGGRMIGPDGRRFAYGKPGLLNGAFTAVAG